MTLVSIVLPFPWSWFWCHSIDLSHRSISGPSSIVVKNVSSYKILSLFCISFVNIALAVFDIPQGLTAMPVSILIWVNMFCLMTLLIPLGMVSDICNGQWGVIIFGHMIRSLLYFHYCWRFGICKLKILCPLVWTLIISYSLCLEYSSCWTRINFELNCTCKLAKLMPPSLNFFGLANRWFLYSLCIVWFFFISSLNTSLPLVFNRSVNFSAYDSTILLLNPCAMCCWFPISTENLNSLLTTNNNLVLRSIPVTGAGFHA